jgi:cytohesin
MYPVTEGMSAAFWRNACGALILPDDKRDNLEGWGGSTYSPRDGYFIWADINFHGEDLQIVPIDKASADLPKVVAYLEKHINDKAMREKVRQGFKAWVAADPDKSDAALLVAKLRQAALDLTKATTPKFYDYALESEKAFEERWRRLGRYWLNVVFECLWLAGLVVWAMWPWLRRSEPWRWWLHIGLAPFLLFLPWFLGYCGMALTSAGPVGGVLYPWLLFLFQWLGPRLGSLDSWVLQTIPKPLGWLTQGTGPMMSLSGLGCIFPIGSLLVGGLAGGAVFEGRRRYAKWRAAHPRGPRAPLSPRTKIIIASALPALAVIYFIWLWGFVPDRLHEAAYRGDVERVEAMLAGGADPNRRGGVGRPMKFLGVTVWSLSSPSEATPLLLAVLGSHERVVEVLLDAGADVDAKHDCYNTAFIYALLRRDHRIAMMILEAGPDLDAANLCGLGPLHWAMKSEDTSVALALIERGFDVSAKARGGWSPLHGASGISVAKALLGKGADPKAVDDTGNTTLHYQTNVEIIRLLVAAGADPNAANKRGQTSMHTAMGESRDSGPIKALAEAGANVNARDAEGNTPLHGYWQLESIAAIVEAGADVNARNNDGDTPLHVAAGAGHLAIMKALVSAGADPTIKNTEGLTPLANAAARDVHPLVAEFLVKAGDRPETGAPRAPTPVEDL